jgi:hypothetical protein
MHLGGVPVDGDRCDSLDASEIAQVTTISGLVHFQAGIEWH